MYRELKDSDKEKESEKMVMHTEHTLTHSHTEFFSGLVSCIK